jgi:glycosyltransferase involved in cell wall biosynthesis
MAPRTPFLLVGDAPEVPSGLGRILRDLTAHLQADEDLSATLDIGVCGYAPWPGLPVSGIAAPADRLVRHWRFSDIKHWGAEAVVAAYRSFYGNRPGIVMTVWDPARCFAYTDLPLPIRKWGYFAVDARGPRAFGAFGGPAAEAVCGYDRVLAYTGFGASILSQITKTVVPHLPHGLDLDVFTYETSPELKHWVSGWMTGQDPSCTGIIGCVATNQARKYYPAYFKALAILRRQQPGLRGWVHTNALVHDAWSLPQLADDYGVADAVRFSLELSDAQLAACYSACLATIAPGLGEGFGYPILESLACGTPVAHLDYAGGREITGLTRVPWTHETVEGQYGLSRPVLEAERIVNALAPVLNARVANPAAMALELRTKVLGYDWPTLWPAWKNWFQEGLTPSQE